MRRRVIGSPRGLLRAARATPNVPDASARRLRTAARGWSPHTRRSHPAPRPGSASRQRSHRGQPDAVALLLSRAHVVRQHAVRRQAASARAPDGAAPLRTETSTALPSDPRFGIHEERARSVLRCRPAPVRSGFLQRALAGFHGVLQQVRHRHAEIGFWQWQALGQREGQRHVGTAGSRPLGEMRGHGVQGVERVGARLALRLAGSARRGTRAGPARRPRRRTIE